MLIGVVCVGHEGVSDMSCVLDVCVQPHVTHVCASYVLRVECVCGVLYLVSWIRVCNTCVSMSAHMPLTLHSQLACIRILPAHNSPNTFMHSLYTF